MDKCAHSRAADFTKEDRCVCVNTAVLIKFSLFEADCVTEQTDSYLSSVSTIECFINVLRTVLAFIL